MKCIVGLGNPGREYADTRHNAGFRIIALLTNMLKISLKPGKGEFLFGKGMYSDSEVLLVVPLTYMNDSGVAVRDVIEQFGIELGDLLLVYDDFQLPLGQLRFRENGSDGGHNGMASVIYHLNTEEIQRLRIGIGGASLPNENRKDQMADYVLAPFEKDEEPIITAAVNRAATAVQEWIQHGIVYTMNRFNATLNN